MVHVRKLVLAIAAASALSSGMAQALVLGELTLKSTASQPLLAEIELRDVRDLTAAEVVPTLAPPDAFAKAGVSRDGYLNDLVFTPVINASGRSVIRVTSSQPLSAPMVKFLVQVVYPAGRLMRDYSMLVDPARFSPQAAQAQNAPKPAVTGANATSQYTTTARDTLWEIAARYRNGASVQQTMLAIQALNPDAFIDANINRLKSGQVLRLPDGQQSTALPQTDAIAEVARQNAAWRDGRRLGPRAQQLDATRRSSGNAGPDVNAQQDKLSLVSGARSNGKGAAGDARALNDKLATTQEDLDATRRNNDELKSRNGDLQGQIDKLQKLIQLKNDQLARLQAAGIDVNAGGAAGAAAGAAAAGTPGSAPASAAPTPPGVDGAAAPATAPSANAAPTPPINATLNLGAPAAEPVTPATAPAVSTPPEAPAVVPAEAQPSLADKMRSNPILYGLIAGGVVLLLLLGALLLARRRNALAEAEKHKRMAAALTDEPLFREEDFDMPPGSFDGLETPPNVRLTPAAMAAAAAAAQASEHHEPSTNAVYRPAPPLALDTPPSVASLVVGPAADDVLLEAERAIDHGRLNHAADILEAGVAREPERSDLRLKLMEVYAEQGDRDAFVGEERQLVANGRNHAEAEALKARYPAMLGAAALGLSAAAVAAELDAQYVKDLLSEDDAADAPEPIGEVFDTDFDLSLDGVDPLTTAEDDELPNVDEDFDALLARSTAEQQAVGDELADFDLDLGADDPAPSAVDDLDTAEPLSTLDEPAKPVIPPVKEEVDLSSDFDLSLPDDDEVESKKFASDLDDVNAELDRLSMTMAKPALNTSADDLDDEFDFLAGTDEVTTKLDLARAYIEMQDADGARDILDEVVKEGSEAQRTEARKMLSGLA
jgi:pilus assembly protein FimV